MQGDPRPVDVPQQFWMADEMPQLQVDLPGQQQIVELDAQHQQLRQAHVRSLEANVDVRAGAMPLQGPRAIEHHPLDEGMLCQQRQNPLGGLLRESRMLALAMASCTVIAAERAAATAAAANAHPRQPWRMKRVCSG